MDLTTILAAVLAASVTAFGAYLVAAKRLSGKIKTSDASDLWAESKSLREDLRVQLDTSSARTSNLEVRVNTLEIANLELRRERSELATEVVRLNAIIGTLEGTIRTLHDEIRALEATVRSQRQELEEG